MSAKRGDDLGDKVTEYQAVRSIQQYLVIDAIRHWVRRYTRNADGLFVVERDYIGGLLAIDSIRYTLDIDGLYREARLQGHRGANRGSNLRLAWRAAYASTPPAAMPFFGLGMSATKKIARNVKAAIASETSA
jgi:hypothetical protein